MHSWPINVEIHVGDQEALGARRRRLDDHVDLRFRGQRCQQRPRVGAVEIEVHGDSGIEPAAANETGQGLRGALDEGIAERRPRRIGDERGDEVGRRHGLSPEIRALRLTIRALLIAGPTASGKTAVALALARRFGAIIVNADSMQVYRDLRILTARPGEAEQRQAPHRLFGEIDGAVNFSVGGWLTAAERIAAEAEALGPRAPPLLFVGGTGLYFRALTRGLSEIPAVPDEVRGKIRAQAEGRRRRSCTPIWRVSIPSPLLGCVPATGSGFSVRWRCSRRPASRSRPFRGRDSRPCSAPANGPDCFSRPSAPRWTAA